ncbi:conserved Plasmodium protein, unknown function [Plasmodium knowlesi strain H]|uniref:Merozoite surface protein 3 n=3 Tax=Plasmodium knowlesi TaxID=5850 RepID=A0A5E7X033_PLAKH|nr:conserved Plasmodium protein, unknown function [Plasmodium knowlesi strain H]OTN68400.1 Uncharacterized protein PKNOH_S03336100 [Plasmodium knowlesi]CAA9987258.1 conserved Plasmodium protein, unknown function [Plasmodium knowlesi strain H]SBO24032.1 conserved Plasmodium protein, unknown function [Plasmodium knowlesi strain H]SBO26050.1 conserved Plasmodium protein, unknown function [Plasmodium knowlesi strain H]VVS76732.1 conserved Plasmodium protein, unknown function [Plasmodium knowlesi s
MGKFSDFSIFYFVFLLNFCLYKNGIQGYSVANEVKTSFRNGTSNNDHNEQTKKALDGRNGTRQNVRTHARHYHGAVVGSAWVHNLRNSSIKGNAEEEPGEESPVFPPGTPRTATEQPGQGQEQELEEVDETNVQNPRVNNPGEKELNLPMNNEKVKIELEEHAETSMNDIEEEVLEEIYEESDDNEVEEKSDEDTQDDNNDDVDNNDDDEDVEVVFRYDNDEEIEERTEEQGLHSLLNDETIHMIHLQEYTDIDEEKEKVEELIQYMTNSLEENEEFVDTLNGFSSDMTMYLQN